MRIRRTVFVICIACGACAPSEPDGGVAGHEDFTCFVDDSDLQGGVIKEQGPFTEDELAIFAYLYDELVVGSLLGRIEGGGGGDVHRVLLSLATHFENRIEPPDVFLKRISGDQIEVRGGGMRGRDVTMCELRLYWWLTPDSAYVKATVMRFGGGVSRTAVAVRDGDRWRICPSTIIGTIN